jgi:hypothetical protein
MIKIFLNIVLIHYAYFWVIKLLKISDHEKLAIRITLFLDRCRCRGILGFLLHPKEG